MIRILLFVVTTLFFIYVSRRVIFRLHSHGFYRFFAWEFILTLILLNSPHWLGHPFSSTTMTISSVLLVVSLFLLAQGIYLLKIYGKPDPNRTEPELMAFEKTSNLVTVGAFKYIRHPLYSSLLFLTWGAFFKHPSLLALTLAVPATIFLLLTAQMDEQECLQYFGPDYRSYMLRTKKFIPLLF